MCTNQNEAHELNTRNAKKKMPEKKTEGMTVNELLSAISETEYPQYILEALANIRDWMNEAINKTDDEEGYDPLTAIFEHTFDFDEDDNGSIENLFERLYDVEKFADVLPNTKAPGGKADTLVINIAPPDYEGGLRAAIDYAAVFNRQNCRRVWIISNSFIFDEIIKYSPHVDALANQGITLRFILVTPWGWVELPLSGATASKNQFVWRNSSEELDKKKYLNKKENKRRRKK